MNGLSGGGRITNPGGIGEQQALLATSLVETLQFKENFSTDEKFSLN